MTHLTWMVCEMKSKWPYSYCFFKLLLSGFVQNSMQHPCVITMKLLSLGVSSKSKWCNHTIVLLSVVDSKFLSAIKSPRIYRTVNYFCLMLMLWFVTPTCPKKYHLNMYLPNSSTMSRMWHKVNFHVKYSWGTHGVMVTVVGNGLCKPSSNPGLVCLHFTYC